MRQTDGLLLLLATGFCAIRAAYPATITVNSTADTISAASCTLRAAITAANMNAASGGCLAGDPGPAVDTIAFNIPSSDLGCSATTDVCTIALTSGLPAMADPVAINGYTQPGSSANTLSIGDNAKLLVEIDATNAGGTVLYFGRHPDSSGSSLRGLVINHIPGSGISCGFGDCADNLTIAGNFLDTDASGSTGSGGGAAISLVTDTGATIGGTAPADRNVIARTILLQSCSNTTIQGNYIGLQASGNAALQIAGDAINAANIDHLLIGGGAAGAGNVIGGWTGNAIILASNNFLQPSISNNQIKGNLIGTNAAGNAVLLPGQVGIAFGPLTTSSGAGTGNSVGGSAPGEGNVVAGASEWGISMQTDETDVVIQGNFVGTDASGTRALPNAVGIVTLGSSGTFGGAVAGSGNVVAFNATKGINVASGTNWAIVGNAIYANAGLGISLGGNTIPTPNDDGDADTGPNNLQNYPILDTVTIGPVTTVQVSGSLNSGANTTYHVEFFANANCDASGNGQGKIFLRSSSIDVTTNPNDVSFGPLALTVPRDRHVITATATDPAGNTSEFSNCALQDTIFTDSFEGD